MEEEVMERGMDCGTVFGMKLLAGIHDNTSHPKSSIFFFTGTLESTLVYLRVGPAGTALIRFMFIRCSLSCTLDCVCVDSIMLLDFHNY